MAREKHSYDILKSLLPNSNIYHVPDIVLSYKPSVSKHERMGLGLCLRSDLESILAKEKKDELKTKLEKHYNISEFDTDVNQILTENVALQKLSKLIDDFASYEVVVTDRLHGLIFAAINK